MLNNSQLLNLNINGSGNQVIINMPILLNQNQEDLLNPFLVRKNAVKKIFLRITPIILIAFFISNCATIFLENKSVNPTTLSSVENLVLKALTWGSLTSVVELIKDKIALKAVDNFSESIRELWTGKKYISSETENKQQLQEQKQQIESLEAKIRRLESLQFERWRLDYENFPEQMPLSTSTEAINTPLLQQADTSALITYGTMAIDVDPSENNNESSMSDFLL